MKKIKRIIKSIRLYFVIKRYARHYAIAHLRAVSLISDALGEEGGE